MSARVLVSISVVSLVAILGLALPVIGDEPKDEYGLAVGKKMPFHVADFANGKNASHGGCPSVMIANSRGRGVIIWSRGMNDAALELAKSLDAAATEDDKLLRFLVAYEVDAKKLAESAGGLHRVVVGRSRNSAKDGMDGRGITPETTVLVFLLDKKDIKAAWSFKTAELDKPKIKELVAEVQKFVAVGRVTKSA